MYTADALRGELTRLAGRSHYHSITIAGRDPLAEAEYLLVALGAGAPLPVMLDHDGQRPDALRALLGTLTLVQVGMDGCETAAAIEHVTASLALAATKRVTHAVSIIPAAAASDAQLWRIVEQVHGASGEAVIIVHPTEESASDADRRWILWLERAAELHGDVRVLPRLPAPTGLR
jgi:hypothetical protein